MKKHPSKECHQNTLQHVSRVIRTKEPRDRAPRNIEIASIHIGHGLSLPPTQIHFSSAQTDHLW